MPSFDIVASAENTWYMMWQAMLFHYSCVTYQGQVPILVVHQDGDSLLPGFERIAERGGRIQAAPNYRRHRGVDYPPRNTAGSLRHVASDAEYLVLCDADMLFLRPLPLETIRWCPRRVSLDAVSYLVPDKAEFSGQLEEVCRRAGVPFPTLVAQPLSGGVPHVIPRLGQRDVSDDWLQSMECFPTFALGPDFECPRELRAVPQQYWTTTMWAFVLTVHRLGLEPILTRWCALNYPNEARLPSLAEHAEQAPSMIHYCYSQPGFDKRLYFDEVAAESTVWNPAPGDDSIGGAIRRQLAEAAAYYGLSRAVP